MSEEQEAGSKETRSQAPHASRFTFHASRFTLLLLLAAAFLFRLAPLGRTVTPDEPGWVYRAIHFADALAAGDPGASPFTGHPGVTTMWLGALGVQLQQWLDPAGSAAHLDWIRRMAWLAPENGEAFRHLAFFLSAGRVAVALVTVLGLWVAYRLAARAFDRRVALLLVGLLAFDPFLVGHSGLLHVDGLLATFVLLAFLAGFNGLKGARPVLWWALAGLFSGLAVLTKTPALAVLGFGVGVLCLLMACSVLRGACSTLCVPGSVFRDTHHAPRNTLHASRSTFPASRFTFPASRFTFPASRFTFHASRFTFHASRFTLHVLPHLLSTLALLSVAALTVFALYPALWADPLRVAQTLGGLAGRHIEMVQRPIFFAGRMTYDPGPAFYPVVFLCRVSPVVLVGLAAALACWRRMPIERRLAFLGLLAFAVLFAAAMSLGAKKHDRYLLPVFPLLTLAASLVLAQVLHPQSAVPVSPRLRVSPTPRLPLSASPPPRVPASPPLLLPVALQLLLLLPFAAYPLGAFNLLAGGPWVAERVLEVDWGEGMGATARWLNQRPDADQLTVAAENVPCFAALFVGRTVPLSDATAPLADYSVLASPCPRVSASPCLRVSASPCLPLSASLLTDTASLEQAAYLSAHVAAGDLILLDAAGPLLRRYEGAGTLLAVADLPDEPAIAARLAGAVPTTGALWVVSSPAASPITARQLQRQVELIATPVSTVTVAGAVITRFSPSPRPPLPASPYRADFNGQLRLVDGAFPASVAWPDALPVVLRWQAPTIPSADFHVVMTLRDGENRAWSCFEWPLVDGRTFPTSAWAAGDWADVAQSLAVPPGIPPDVYTVEVSLVDASGAALGAVGPDGAFLGTQVVLGAVRVLAPQSPPDPALAEVPVRLDLPAGPLTLLGMGALPAQVASGDSLPLTLFWQATAAPSADYRLRLRLADSAGRTALEEVTALSPYPTSRWRAGDWFESRGGLRVRPDLPAGRYGLRLDVLDEAGEPLWEMGTVVGEVDVLARERSFALPTDIPHQFDILFGGIVHLRGYALDRTEAVPGGALALTLYWQADGPTDRDYTLFVHLLGPDGRLHGQVDRPPGAGLAPSTTWAAGQVLVDEVTLPVAADAPPGVYRIAVGFYDAVHGSRLPVGSEADQAVLPVEIVVR